MLSTSVEHLGHGRLADRQELRRPPEVAELVEGHHQLQVAQLDVGTQHTVDLGHGRIIVNQGS
jgi:hypothetical protein